jgi:hypothetical protein
LKELWSFEWSQRQLRWEKYQNKALAAKYLLQRNNKRRLGTAKPTIEKHSYPCVFPGFYGSEVAWGFGNFPGDDTVFPI